MNIKKNEYCLFLFVIIAIQGYRVSASINTKTQQAKSITNNSRIDSLINDSYNRVYQKPNESIELGLTIFNDINNSKKTRIRALTLVSLGYMSKRDYQKALKYIIKAKDFSTDLKSINSQLEILFMTGVIYQQLKIFDKSIEYMGEIEEIALAYPVYDSVGIYLANSYTVKGFIYKEDLNCDIALDFFNKGIKEYEKLKTINQNLSITHYNKGNCYIILSEFENAKNSFNKSLVYAQKAKANSLISFAQKGLAEVYTLEGRYEEAIALLLSAQDKSIDVGDLILNQTIYKGLFENYLALNNWDDYQKYYDLYIKTQLEIKISERESVSISFDEILKEKLEKQTLIKNKFFNKLKWSLFIPFLIILIAILIKLKNDKSIKTLQNKIKSIQNSKSS